MTASRLLKLTDSVDRGEISLANALSWPDLDHRERTELPVLVEYERRRLQWRRPRTRAAVRRSYRLLRSFLNSEQRRQLRNSRSFRIELPNGHAYRVWLIWDAIVERVHRHGQRWLAHWAFCIHPPNTEDGFQIVPPADVALSHLLLLMDSEERFLEIANPRPRRIVERGIRRLVAAGRISLADHPGLAALLEGGPVDRPVVEDPAPIAVGAAS